MLSDRSVPVADVTSDCSLWFSYWVWKQPPCPGLSEQLLQAEDQSKLLQFPCSHQLLQPAGLLRASGCFWARHCPTRLCLLFLTTSCLLPSVSVCQGFLCPGKPAKVLWGMFRTAWFVSYYSPGRNLQQFHTVFT